MKLYYHISVVTMDAVGLHVGRGTRVVEVDFPGEPADIHEHLHTAFDEASADATNQTASKVEAEKV